MKKTAITRITAIVLAAITIMLMGCVGAFAATEKTGGGADVYIGSEVIHYDNISDAWSKAASSKKEAKMVLNEDWVADINGSFGTGKYFLRGAINLCSHSAKLTLDLNGHKIDRRLSSAAESGSVFYIRYTDNFIITDSSKEQSGVITGGYAKVNGGALHISGSNVIIENMAIKNNRSGNRGGALYIDTARNDYGTRSAYVIVDNCVISENIAKTGGAVYLETSNWLTFFDSVVTKNNAVNDAGVHTEVKGLNSSCVTLGGKVYIAENYCRNSGSGLMLDEGLFEKATVRFSKIRPFSDDSRIVVLTKTNDKSLRMTENSDNSHIGSFECENSNYNIVAKGSGNKQYLDFVKILNN